MTQLDLHPEELIEGARAGFASAAELERIQAHLSACDVCRAEHALMDQAQADATPDSQEARRIARLTLAVQRTLRGGAVGRPRKTRLTATTAMAAVALTIASGAAAALVVQKVSEFAAKEETEHTQSVATEKSAALQNPIAAGKPPLSAPEEADPAESAPEEEVPTDPNLVPAEPETSTSRTAQQPSAETQAPKPQLTAQELFAEANQARRQGNAAEAAKLYKSLQTRFSGSSEELVSRVTLGRLLLDRLGDPGGALVQFNSYLAHSPQAALRHEALVGRALALQRLGREVEEQSAWQTLLKNYPRSTNAQRATARIEQLGGADTLGVKK